MGGYRKRRYVKKPFESKGSNSDTSANIYMSMLQSEAWHALTPNQQVLYVYCKAQYYAEKKHPNGDPLCFTMNQSKWNKLYGLYTKNNARGFYRDITALIEHGFIICVESGQATRTKSIYRFSDAWQRYGTEAFRIAPSEMNTTLLRRMRCQR